MSAEAAVRAGRMAAESLMRSTCRITRPGVGASTLNATSLQYSGPADLTVYEGPCKVQDATTGAPATTEAVEAFWSDQGRRVDLPVESSVGVRRDDVVTILTNPDDPELVDRKFTVKGLHHKTLATARRLMCAEGV